MKTCSIYLLASLLMLATLVLPVNAQQGDPSVEAVKIKVAKLGVGAKAKATVIQKNGTKTKGYIAQAGDDDFVVRDRKTDAATTIRYTEVAKVESNKGHSTARNIAIGVGVGAGVVITVLFLLIASLD